MLVYSPKLEGYYYTPQSQKAEGIEKPFRVKLKVLSVEDLAELQDMLVTRTALEVKNNYGSYFINACYRGIIDWENMENSDGSQIKMTKSITQCIDKEALNMIPYQMIEEIGTVIISVSENPKNLAVFADK